MRAHIVSEDGTIINTIVVDDLNVFPNLVDASIGGNINDKIVDGKIIPTSNEIAIAEMAKEVRRLRDEFLSRDVDSINTFRAATMTPEQLTAWANYRQALLDIPLQSGFPFAVEWPSKP